MDFLISFMFTVISPPSRTMGMNMHALPPVTSYGAHTLLLFSGYHTSTKAIGSNAQVMFWKAAGLTSNFSLYTLPCKDGAW